MIRIHFKTPTKIIQHGLEQECMFVDCLQVVKDFGIVEMYFGKEDIGYCNFYDIEKITPTQKD